MMRSKASTLLKQMVSTIVAVVKAKSTAVRAKTSAMRTRLLIFGVLRNRRLLATAINHKIHALIGAQDTTNNNNNNISNAGDVEEVEVDDSSKKKAIVQYSSYEEEEEEEEDDYLTHSLFMEEEEDEDDELVNAQGSVIDLVRDAKEGEGGEFRLEDEIDHVADVFIRRIHKQLKLQKLDSFKRFCEMLERSA
uniref:Uncharacterized protein n=1 Tax=Leersia perrieri TaxID=77586 RepID=A0A0D9W464_9ORYZ